MANTRKLLFRGQTRKYGEKVKVGTGEKLPGQWVYGGIFHGTGDFSVIYGWEAEEEQTGANLKKLTVYSDTVGQYTGITDKNGVKIFEGDIVKIPYRRDFGIVCFERPECQFLYNMQGDGDFVEMAEHGSEVEVIGNIYDSPELLK